MAMWKLKLAIWKFNMALGKLQMAMWKLKMATWKLKKEHFEAKKQVLDPKFSKMTAPNFGPNSLCGPSTVLKEGGQTKGGPQKTPPRRQKL